MGFSNKKKGKGNFQHNNREEFQEENCIQAQGAPVQIKEMKNSKRYNTKEEKLMN